MRIVCVGNPALPVIGRMASIKQEFSLIFSLEGEFAVHPHGDIARGADEGEVLRRSHVVAKRRYIVIIVAGPVQFIKGQYFVPAFVRNPFGGISYRYRGIERSEEHTSEPQSLMRNSY